MAKAKIESVDEYMALQPEPARAILARVRRAIRKAMPDAEEGISYQIPTYKLLGRAALYFAGWKAHYSLYPAGERLLAEFRDELAAYHVDKGTIRFPLSKSVPDKLIEAIATFRAKEVAAGNKGKTGRRSRGQNPGPIR
jgi:uncharacterized protein YdhG (YjbR/CyaY superfamily)